LVHYIPPFRKNYGLSVMIQTVVSLVHPSFNALVSVQLYQFKDGDQSPTQALNLATSSVSFARLTL